MDEEEELRTRQAVEAQVKRRAQELFEAMRQLEEEKERQRLASEIDRRVADEARRKAETLLRAEDEERERRKAAAAAEAEAEAAAAEVKRLADEKERARKEREALFAPQVKKKKEAPKISCPECRARLAADDPAPCDTCFDQALWDWQNGPLIQAVLQVM